MRIKVTVYDIINNKYRYVKKVIDVTNSKIFKKLDLQLF